MDRVYLDKTFGLTEARTLYEIAVSEPAFAGAIGATLAIDRGYLSRILRSFERQGLIERHAAAADGRKKILALTARGRETLASLHALADARTADMLAPLAAAERRRLLAAMGVIERTLNGPSSAPIVFRDPQLGDLGYITHRHALLFGREFGWDQRFELAVARELGAFFERFEPTREKGWVAEIDGVFVGCGFLFRESDRVGRLRMLLTEPWARGRGLGMALTNRILDFARRADYGRVVLWTCDALEAARRLYRRAGFEIAARERETRFGRSMIGETWSIDLESLETGAASRAALQ